MRIVILTSRRFGFASRCLPELCRRSALEVAGVVLADKRVPHRFQHLRRKLRKIQQIGLLGALNGIRLRRWFRDRSAQDLVQVCQSLGVPVHSSECVNCETTRRLFRQADADLGLSLGNGYIAESVFSLPRFGMINLHSEVLPRFQGAMTVLWPIYEGLAETGFTIHQIDRHIDTGDILFGRRFPIVFGPTLRQTVERNLETIRSLAPTAIADVCEQYESLRKDAIRQDRRSGYTTPTLTQYIRMVRNHTRMSRQYSQSKSGGHDPLSGIGEGD